MRRPALQNPLHDQPTRSSPPAEQTSRGAYRLLPMLALHFQRLVIWTFGLRHLLSNARIECPAIVATVSGNPPGPFYTWRVAAGVKERGTFFNRSLLDFCTTL